MKPVRTAGSVMVTHPATARSRPPTRHRLRPRRSHIPRTPASSAPSTRTGVPVTCSDDFSGTTRFPSGFTRVEWERYFFLDDLDRALVERNARTTTSLGSPSNLDAVALASSVGNWPAVQV